METLNRFYTYAYLREDGTPYYIGKGKGNRAFSSNRTINRPKDKSRIIFLKQNLTEEEAFKHEIYMINVFGRKDLGTGILHNRTDGGEGTVNVIRTKEHLEALCEGRKHIYTEQHSKKISETLKSKNIKPPLQTGKKWWYNGEETTLSRECPGDEWKLGRPSVNKWCALNK